MHRLLVVSIFSASCRNEAWLGLQRRFLDRTVGGRYEAAYCLSDCDPALFGGSTVCSLPAERFEYGRASLLRAALDFCLSRPDFDDYLLLDSDAFPFRTAWYERLVAVMQADEAAPERSYVALARVEGAETWPCPSVLFIRGPFLRSLGLPFDFFDFTPRSVRTFDGRPVTAVGPGLKTFDRGRPCWFPLLRTNALNGHPILGGVYGGLFYHHNAGSRPAEFDAVNAKLYDTAMSRFRNTDADSYLFSELNKDPEQLLCKMVGLTDGRL